MLSDKTKESISNQPVELVRQMPVESTEIKATEPAGTKETYGGISGYEVHYNKEAVCEALKLAQQPKKERQPLDFSSLLDNMDKKTLIR